MSAFVKRKIINSFMSRHLSTRNISSKSMHAFLSNLAHSPTDRQTKERGRAGENIPPPLSEVNKNNNKKTAFCKVQNIWSSDALHRRAGVESFQFLRKIV